MQTGSGTSEGKGRMGSITRHVAPDAFVRGQKKV
jgi:hypothetical protein